MSDTRFTMIGIAMVFAGFMVLGVLGHAYGGPVAIEADEFGVCHQHRQDGPPEEVDCSDQAAKKALFFALVLGLIGCGIACLVVGVRGGWDQKVRPEDMVGPGGDRGDGHDDGDGNNGETAPKKPD